MNRVFHNARHWQLFVLTTGQLVVSLIVGILHTAWIVKINYEHSREDALTINIILEAFQFFVDLVLFGWFWSIGIGLKNKLPSHVQLNHTLFITFFFLALAYSVYDFIGAIYYEYFWDDFKNKGGSRQMSSYILSFSNLNPFVLLLTLLATFCNFYLFYFCAKTLKSSEIGREADFSESIGYFFLIWFHFIGLWIIQPSVNRITSGDWEPPAAPTPINRIVTPTPIIDPEPKKEIVPPGERLKTINHSAFEHDDDCEGLL